MEQTTSQTIHPDDSQPATKADFRVLDSRISNVEKRLDTLHRDMDGIRQLLFQAIMGGAAILGGLIIGLIGAIVALVV